MNKKQTIKEFHNDDYLKPDNWDNASSSCGCGDIGSGPEMFSDAIRTMPVSELLNQLKGTNEGLYRKLVYYIRDTYHENNSPTSEPSFESPMSIEAEPNFESPISIEDMDSSSSCGISKVNPIHTISIIRKESKQKGPSFDLMLEAWKAKKAMKTKSKKMSKKSKM